MFKFIVGEEFFPSLINVPINSFLLNSICTALETIIAINTYCKVR